MVNRRARARSIYKDKLNIIESEKNGPKKIAFRE